MSELARAIAEAAECREAAARGDVGALHQMEAWVAEEMMIRAEVGG